MKRYAIGVDIGGTNTVVGMVDAQGECVATLGFKTREFEYIDDYVGAICDNIEKLVGLVADCELVGIGIGAPNMVYHTGCIEKPANLFWKDRQTGDRMEIIPMAEMIRHRFPDTLVRGTNDANTAAIGEMCFGGARGMKDFVVITLGTGLGSGFVANGELIYGHDGGAGELGHVIVERDGRMCTCGNRGCLEKYASATGIRNTVLEMLADPSKDSSLREIPVEQLDSRAIYDAAVKGDAVAMEAFEITGHWLGFGLAMAVAVTSPEAIFLFGGLAAAGNLILEPTKRYMEHYLLRNYRDKVKILPSGVDGGNAAILGAAALIWQDK